MFMSIGLICPHLMARPVALQESREWPWSQPAASAPTGWMSSLPSSSAPGSVHPAPLERTALKSRHISVIEANQDRQTHLEDQRSSHRTLKEAGDPLFLLSSRARRGVLRGLHVLQNPIAGATLHWGAFGSGGCTHPLCFLSYNLGWLKRTERYILRKRSKSKYEKIRLWVVSGVVNTLYS